MAHLPCAPNTSQYQVALPGSGRLVKIAHPGTWLWQHLWQHLAPAKNGHRQNRTGRFSRRAFALRRSVLHRASVRGLFRSPRHQTAADHKRQQDGNKDSQFQIVHHAFLRVRGGAPQSGAWGLPSPLHRQRSHRCCGSECGHGPRFMRTRPRRRSRTRLRLFDFQR